MYSSSVAEIYDLLHATHKDYAAEASDIAGQIRRVHPQAKTVLDVACGTAEHARLLVENHQFQVDGLDINPSFVRIARTKLVGGSVFEADMTSFVLPARYDVVLCLFSS